MTERAQQPARADGIGICILAGGEATRLPGKLFLAAGDVPMLVRVYRNVSPGRETWISTKGALPAEIDAALAAPMVVDRWTRRGPLSGLLSTMSEMRTEWVFACAGDAPFVDAAFVDRLAVHVADTADATGGAGLEAVVPAHDQAGRRIEPLAALYRREAFLREGLPVLLGGDGALRLVIDRLRTKFVPVPEDERALANVNTPQDYAALRPALTGSGSPPAVSA
ncbi:MAG: molybdenum cofactor guanylyltransferase [Candidatus Eremiobacteraeota bacterium]|nr:molybdenum cofactor guanylyltransferase [Candidatus Eremiobacteraeota bacterium]